MTQRLTTGLSTFRSKEFPRRQEQFEALAAGQSPRTLFITCSDSRIDPSLVTQTDPGELFVIRNAGNIVPPLGEEPVGGEAATLEYAVVALGVKDIVVCGHSHCGAMAGLMNPDTLKPLPGVASFLRHAHGTRKRVEQTGANPIQTNVRVQLDHLRSYPFVKEREERGELTLHGWVYVFEAGEVFELQADGGFRPLLESTGVTT